ncbi:phosphatase PAP2 family protein [Salinarchaeum sp. IM2453]|uniref:phosphatase PAP2 family protein n=1 Tax=Salinarchaeum sp. IM2453 TaxID=2862870 RepID=UPI001C82B719|nr:phosphatase PAP2 family protein [Salinarchaeum sp. IM2453]QZA89137.1 phosphatase PAP2 family protein [Salinarchaeum sp. IM2453]
MLFDAEVVEAVAGGTPTWLALIFLLFSYLGSIYVIGPAMVYVYFRGDDRLTATWPGIVLGGYGLFVILKALINISRPDVASPLADVGLPPLVDQLHVLAVGFETGSFPSGHAIATVVFYGLLILDSDWKTQRLRLFLLFPLILLVGYSRVTLGVHFVGDIIGGFLIGALYLGGMVYLRQQYLQPAQVMFRVAFLIAIGAAIVEPAPDTIGLAVIAGVSVPLQQKLDEFQNTEASRYRRVSRYVRDRLLS